MQALIIDLMNCKISGEVTILDWPKKYEDGLYYKTTEGFVPVAYCFKPDARKYIEKILRDIEKRRFELARYENSTITITLRQHRRDQ